MTVPANRKGVVKRFNNAPKEVRDYFEYLPKLIDQFPWEISLSYLFARVEYSHNMTLYCGVVKLHQGQKDVVFNIVQKQQLTRANFAQLFETVIGKKIAPKVSAKIRDAEKVRDKVLHGKSVSEADLRKAVTRVIEYAESFNNLVKNTAGFKPFDDLRGFKGAGKSLSKETTRWILKGMGFPAS